MFTDYVWFIFLVVYISCLGGLQYGGRPYLQHWNIIRVALQYLGDGTSVVFSLCFDCA